MLQGFAVGGEWAGSVLLSGEYAPTANRGRYGMLTLVGDPIGLVLASLTFLGVNYTIGEHSPAWSTKVAEVFIAKTGAGISVFPTAAELVSWAGLLPGANESAGKIKLTKIRPGNFADNCRQNSRASEAN